ncbi:MAG: isopentenyl phosphate kinase [Candidatus Promineifilaceae bacterium]|nr:isopentenyl phosphate kinase [Candidatus Promineifilaceae bacterium]
MQNVTFLKLGGSLITDKTDIEVLRDTVLKRVAAEINRALQKRPEMRLLLGHGSGSFGHVAGAKYGTRLGVHTDRQWRGFTEVSAAASRLNILVVEALLQAGVPAISLQPSASAVCTNGQIQTLAVQQIIMALESGLVPVVFGDVAFDTVIGGTIISTEEIMMFLANELRPGWLLLAGETVGVLDENQDLIPLITEDSFDLISGALGGSRGTDVTGGMFAKVRAMLDLAAVQPQLRIGIFSGLEKNRTKQSLLAPNELVGTVIQSAASPDP